MAEISPVYRPRNPQASQYYQCVEEYFETLEQVYDERFLNSTDFFGFSQWVRAKITSHFGASPKVKLLTDDPNPGQRYFDLPVLDGPVFQ
ncbi:MAG: hypothetical protein JRJ15_14735 [Deltaproteobacteria bacterium]|nr:hypothetical protein [Deltaproteobacteria bacterium]